jgi:hypothetical protein
VASAGKNTVVPQGLAVFEKWAFTEEVAGCPTSPRFWEKWATTDLDQALPVVDKSACEALALEAHALEF